MRFRFRPRLLPTVATIVVVAVGVSLGNWQARRAATKTALEQKLASRTAAAPLQLGPAVELTADDEYRRVRAAGRFDPDWPVYLDNRPQDGKPGFYVLMPLRLADSERVVWVARGWIARDARDRARVPEYLTPDGSVEVEGIVVRGLGQVMELGSPAPLKAGAVVQNATVGQLAQAYGAPAMGIFIQQTGEVPDRLARNWPAPSLGVDKHRGYAFQWYGLALAAFIFYVVTSTLRGKHTEDKHGNEQEH